MALIRVVATAALVVCSATTNAQTPALSALDFAKHHEVFEVSMSPDGNHVALALPTADGNETQLQIVPLDGSGKGQILRFGKQEHVGDVIWSADDQVVVARASMEPLKARPYSTGELFSSDIRGKNQRVLFAYVGGTGTHAKYRDEGYATVVKVLPKEPGKVLVDFTAWPTRTSDETLTSSIYKVDTRTGNRQETEQVRETASFQFDETGRARIRKTTDKEDRPVMMYRPDEGDAWQPLPKSLAGYDLRLLHVEADNNTAYATIVDDGEPSQLYKVDLKQGTRTKLAGRDDQSIGRMMYAGHEGVPFGVTFEGGAPTVQYLDADSEWAKLHTTLLAAFPGQMVSLLDWSRDNNKVLLYTWSDLYPGAWHVLDRAAKKMLLISEAKPWIKADTLARTQPFDFKTGDGQTLQGLVTRPAGDAPAPMVVMPHGGPHGVYDSWGYDSDAQFLASRGYAVLQVNFRGSGGRGRHFIESGYRQWGGKMQDDIADGVRWAIDNKIADANRICTYGASYGGYAALMQPIRFPALYKCAIGYVGVYDLQVMKKAGDIKDRASGRRYLENALGSDIDQLVKWSPAQNADKIRIPVLLAQGNIDRRVPMAQFDAMTSAFRRQGMKVETMVAKGEGHGFYKPENRAELYRRMEAFLSTHLGH